MDIEPNEDRDIYAPESTDYSYSRVSSNIQSVDYHHGQSGSTGYEGSAYSNPAPPLGAPLDQGTSSYGAYPSYQGYSGYQNQEAFFSGLDPAAIFAAYTEQTGKSAALGGILASYDYLLSVFL